MPTSERLDLLGRPKPHVQTVYKIAFFGAIPEIVAFVSSTSYRG
jgi:hypothetical protein